MRSVHRAKSYRNVAAYDDSIGKLLEALRQRHLEDSTLVIVTVQAWRIAYGSEKKAAGR